MADLAIFYDVSAYSFKERTMGRQSAGIAFMQALADSRPQKIWCYTSDRPSAQECARTLTELGSPKTGVVWVALDQQKQLEEPGLLYRPDPALGQHAWHRLAHSNPRAYSLCGITHTISSHAPMSAIAEYITAPLETWDAVICTSPAAREAVRHVVEEQAEYLSERLGATRFSLPQLPVIPLGVHTRAFAATNQDRQAARSKFGISADEVVILYAGRLIAHGKAHPLAMYLALEQAAKGYKVTLIQAGQSPHPEILRIFVDEPKRFCPSVRQILVDGADKDLYRAAWAAADIFTSLADNVQETFGLTPIEAMAAALPVVVSDWDGYRDTVRDGIDGFRIPTLSLPPGSGRGLAHNHDLGLYNFDRYSAYASQMVAVSVEAAAHAYRRLIEDADLRARMGAAGAQRAREVFDWSVIFRRYVALWEELSERRRSDPQLVPKLSKRQRPDRADPFSMFATYPTHHGGPTTAFRHRAGIDLAEAVSRRQLTSTGFAKSILPAPELIEKLLSVMGAKWTPLDVIVHATPGTTPEAITSALIWLSKVGVTDFRS